MKKDVTELVIIIDKSGSMHGLEKDVIGGFNSLIEEQKKEGETIVTTIFFNGKKKLIHEGVDIKEVKPLDGRSYQPSGCTALLDAVGDAISLIKAKHSRLKEEDLPEHTIFSIMTDGLENSSREYSYPRVKEMIKFQEKCGWEFIFQAANIDVEREADRLGIKQDMAHQFIADEKGVAMSMFKACATITDIKRKNKKAK